MLLETGLVEGCRHQTSRYTKLQIVMCYETKEESSVESGLTWEVREDMDKVGFKLVL